MISLDGSLVPAIVIFILTVVALNYLLFRPVARVQEERESKTTGLMSRTREDLAHHLRLFDEYQATIKNARLEGYRLVEKVRSEALRHRGEALEQAKRSAEELILEARESTRQQVAEGRIQLESEAQEMAQHIASAVLHRPS